MTDERKCTVCGVEWSVCEHVSCSSESRHHSFAFGGPPEHHTVTAARDRMSRACLALAHAANEELKAAYAEMLQEDPQPHNPLPKKWCSLYVEDPELGPTVRVVRLHGLAEPPRLSERWGGVLIYGGGVLIRGAAHGGKDLEDLLGILWVALGIRSRMSRYGDKWSVEKDPGCGPLFRLLPIRRYVCTGYSMDWIHPPHYTLGRSFMRVDRV